MWSYIHYHKLLILTVWTEIVQPMAILKKTPYILDGGSDNELTDYIPSKGYLPNENELPKISLLKNTGNDITYLLSKLSDDALLKLLNEQPNKSEYYMNDLIKFAVAPKLKVQKYSDEQKNPTANIIGQQQEMNKRFQKVTENYKHPAAFFRLENKQVDPFINKYNTEPQYIAVQKLNNLLYSRPQEQNFNINDVDDDEKKELLFDVLVAQLKTLCCKKNKSKINKVFPQELLNKPFKSGYQPIELSQSAVKVTTEYMFLIINDEIKSNGSDELISVDPESLDNNSSVLLLGPIITPLTDTQLKTVMGRIFDELSKTEYLPLLQQLSEGTLGDRNIKLIKSLFVGPETRRYIKPHRCNHQSKLAQIYGGPKWLICTGYLNLNTPSLYD